MIASRSPVPKVAAPEPITGESRDPAVIGALPAPQRNLRKEWRPLARLRDVVNRKSLNNLKRARNSYAIASGEIQIRNTDTIAHPIERWGQVTRTNNRAESVRILAEILVHKEGRDFFSRLEREDAELCIEILDHVGCRSPHLSVLSPEPSFRESLNTTSSGPRSRRSV